MRWLGLGAPGMPYPAALRALRGRRVSGVYAIRDRESGEVLYVGESHTGRLYETLTRHLQGWARSKGHWKGMGGPNDPGTTYDRRWAEVRWRVTSDATALRAEARWMRSLRPRDNVREGEPLTSRRAPAADLPDIPF